MENVTANNKWTTWEELLLSYAVKRHGLNDWDTVAVEIKSRTSLLPHDSVTAVNCKLKYLDLKRRYAATASTAVHDGDNNDDDNLTVNDDTLDDDDDLPWIEQLRNLRVAELRQEVHRYDDSILSLQLKVKKLEEEREQSIKSNDEKPDLDNLTNEHGSENDVNDRDIVSEKFSPAKIECKLLSADEGFYRRDESVNGSNSTSTTKGESQYSGSKQDDKIKDEPAQSGSVKPDLQYDSLGENSAASMARESASAASMAKGSGLNDASELRESFSVDEWSRLVDDETRDSSNVRGAADLTRRSRRKNVGGRNVDVPTTLTTISGAVNGIVRNSQHFIGAVELIRSHKHGSLFEHRLKSQENDKYDNIVRQHMDLHTIEKRRQQGFYSSCATRFYRDLLLMLNNAIVYLPKSSVEYTSASEIRKLVTNEVSKEQTQRSACSSEPSLSISVQPESKHHKSSAPIVVCRKRSSISSKSNGRKGQTRSEENKKSAEDLVGQPGQSSTKNDEIDKTTVTGTRRRGRKKSSPGNSGNARISDKIEVPKDEKGEENERVSSTKKRGGAADFMKRMNENSPLDKSKSTTRNTRITRQRDAQSAGHGVEKNRTKGIEDKVVPRSKQVAKVDINPLKRNLRPPRKTLDSAPVKRKREAEASTSKPPQKRSKRQ